MSVVCGELYSEPVGWFVRNGSVTRGGRSRFFCVVVKRCMELNMEWHLWHSDLLVSVEHYSERNHVRNDVMKLFMIEIGRRKVEWPRALIWVKYSGRNIHQYGKRSTSGVVEMSSLIVS